MATKPSIKPKIAAAWKLVRVYHGATQAELAEAFEIGRPYISKLENGREGIGLFALERYSDYFNIPVSSIIYIAEHLPLAHAGERRQSPCGHAARILDIEWAKQDLRSELVRKQ